MLLNDEDFVKYAKREGERRRRESHGSDDMSEILDNLKVKQAERDGTKHVVPDHLLRWRNDANRR